MVGTSQATESFSLHAKHSTLRERIVEHVFVGEALRQLWRHSIIEVEVLRSEFDAGGYDLVMNYGKIVRHIQLKTSTISGKATRIKLNGKLADKPSGCILWIIVTTDLIPAHYLWFGGSPGKPLPSLDGFRVAKHSKANAKGKKAERPDHRVIPRTKFKKLNDLDDVLVHLFGPLRKLQSEAA